MICPKCGWEQEGVLECERCGIVFGKIKGGGGSEATAPPTGSAPGWQSGADSGDGGPDLPPPPPRPQPQQQEQQQQQQVYGGSLAAAGMPDVYDGRTGVKKTATTFSGGNLSPGDVISTTFGAYFSNFAPFLMLALIALLPSIIAGYMLLESATQAEQGLEPVDLQQMLILLALTVGLNILAAPIATAGITYGVARELRHKEVRLGDCLAVGLKSIFLVLGVAILQGLAILVGILACIIPGIIVAVMTAVAVPAALEERTGVIGALQRSAELTSGNRWAIFGVLFVFGVISGGLNNIATRLITDPLTSVMVTAGVDTVTTGLTATAAAVMYYHLRTGGGGRSLEQLASVFD